MKKPNLILSLTPLIFLVALLALCVVFFKDDVTSGPAQIALLTSAVFTAGLGIIFLKVPWKKVEESIAESIQQTGPTILILLAIGALTATWMLSGVVPTMIYYGLELISPKIFIPITFVLCCMVSILAGSSWTTVGTIGVAMLAAGKIIGLPAGWIAGAIISGAYLGDKLSPLSDVVNLASSIAGADLYKHVKYSSLTATPAFVICLAVYAVVGCVSPAVGEVDMSAQLSALEGTFNISPWLLLIPALTVTMVVKKVPAFLTLFISAFVAAVVAFWAQPQIVQQVCADNTGAAAAFDFIFKSMSMPVEVETGDAMINTLACTRGMAGMINTVWLILCIMTVSGALAACGVLDAITESLLKLTKGTTSLVATTLGTCIVSNMILSDQYMAVLVPGKMFKDAYTRRGCAPELLSRTLGDSATVSSVMVPWNTCAVVQSTVLGMATMAYFPYAIFCFITPVISLLVVALKIKVKTTESLQAEKIVDAVDALEKGE